MRRIRHTDAPGRYNHSAFDGVSTTGDEHTVSDDLAAYLVADGPFEDTDEVVLEDDEYEVVEDDADDASGCPLCDEYDGDNVAQHASQAHPDEWADYSED